MSKTNEVSILITALIGLDQESYDYVDVASEYREEILSIVEALELSRAEVLNGANEREMVINRQRRRIAQLENESSKLIDGNASVGRSLPDRLDAIEDFIERFKRGMNDSK